MGLPKPKKIKNTNSPLTLLLNISTIYTCFIFFKKYISQISKVDIIKNKLIVQTTYYDPKSLWEFGEYKTKM